ncbi:MAG: SDR family oxidoreductase, partial [Lachnospiraceae bacterium]|nr:SDR family oxidoreductase [Lachnospiraceae bacterium]
MSTAVFLTGATGLLGTEIIKELITAGSRPVYALVRAENEEKAICRLRSFWWEEPALIAAIGDRVKVVCGDITLPNLGIAEEINEKLTSEVGFVVHTAAETGVQNARSKLRKVNTEGTANVVSFARRLQQAGSLERFVHISTAYVAGDRNGRIMETDPLPDTYSTYYEESKADAERIVRSSGLPYTICRPGMIIGSSRTGRTRYFNTIYYVLKLMLQEKLPVIPVSARKKLNIVPADHIAGSVVRLMESGEALNACFHLTAPEDRMPQAGELADYVCGWAERALNVKIRKPVFIPAPFLKYGGALHNRREEEKHKQLFSNLLALTPYFYDDRVFDMTGTEKLLGRDAPDWHEYIDKILDYA